jgi:orotate phosphoribosyltransferase
MTADVRDELIRSGLISAERVDRFVRRGHFVYESGDHGDTWLELEVLHWEPPRMRRATGAFAGGLRKYNPEVICSPLIGGALVGQLLADALGVGFVYAERHGRAGNVRYAIPAGARALINGKRVVIVDDVINAGSASLATLEDVRACGGAAVAVAALMIRAAARSSLAAKAGIPVESVLALDWNIWKSAECPVCEA